MLGVCAEFFKLASYGCRCSNQYGYFGFSFVGECVLPAFHKWFSARVTLLRSLGMFIGSDGVHGIDGMSEKASPGKKETNAEENGKQFLQIKVLALV